MKIIISTGSKVSIKAGAIHNTVKGMRMQQACDGHRIKMICWSWLALASLICAPAFGKNEDVWLKCSLDVRFTRGNEEYDAYRNRTRITWGREEKNSLEKIFVISEAVGSVRLYDPVGQTLNGMTALFLDEKVYIDNALAGGDFPCVDSVWRKIGIDRRTGVVSGNSARIFGLCIDSRIKDGSVSGLCTKVGPLPVKGRLF